MTSASEVDGPKGVSLFLVEDESSASARTRAFDLIPGLAREGVAARVLGLARGRTSRRAQLDEASDAEVVVLSRKLLAEPDLVRLRRAARALVFDFDDAVSERPWDARARGRSWTRPRRFAETLRAADLVVAGSASLGELAARDHARVRVLPTAVAIPARVPVERSLGDGVSGEVVRLVWTGSRATLGYLEALRRPLEALCSRRPRVELVVLADAAPDFSSSKGTARGSLRSPLKSGAARDARPADFKTTFIPFTLEAEEQALARADLGLMPLGPDPWSRGKCGLKLARYMAWGVAPISSRFGAGAELVDAPDSGRLADDEGEWLAALEELVASPILRRAIGTRARAEAAARLSLDARVRSWAAVLREAAAVGAARAGRGALQ